jgi:hypothetical protein
VRHSAPPWTTLDIEVGRNRNVPFLDPNGKRAAREYDGCPSRFERSTFAPASDSNPRQGKKDQEQYHLVHDETSRFYGPSDKCTLFTATSHALARFGNPLFEHNYERYNVRVTGDLRQERAQRADAARRPC